jgi:hypothetical protein
MKCRVYFDNEPIVQHLNASRSAERRSIHRGEFMRLSKMIEFRRRCRKIKIEGCFPSTKMFFSILSSKTLESRSAQECLAGQAQAGAGAP